MTLSTVERLLATSFRVVDALVKNGILPTKEAISPLNRCPYVAIPRAAVDRFMAEFGSLQALAKERGLHFKEFKERLISRDITPLSIANEFEPRSIGGWNT